MATQFIVFLKYFITFVISWLTLWRFTANMNLPHCLSHVVEYAPIYAVLALGVWAASSVICGVFTFNDCNQAKLELVGEIGEARKHLKQRKVI
ncbi:unnamed protein product, partial [Mesorhabditis belari]|uniref:Dolichol-phosphate mannosyltransferase subunit 3 n=1 Tax=Mesorhabditis belari TaxID=2138241 RepID=A0AAF3E8U6_9BILA